jgi:hypothetical protein
MMIVFERDFLGKKIIVPTQVNEQMASVDIDFTDEIRNKQHV